MHLCIPELSAAPGSWWEGKKGRRKKKGRGKGREGEAEGRKGEREGGSLPCICQLSWFIGKQSLVVNNKASKGRGWGRGEREGREVGKEKVARKEGRKVGGWEGGREGRGKEIFGENL